MIRILSLRAKRSNLRQLSQEIATLSAKARNDEHLAIKQLMIC